MSVNYIDKSTGNLIRVAGQGKAEYGASTERKGDITIPATTAGNFQSVGVVFAQAMPDNDYTVVIDEGGNTWAHGATNVTNKTATGFTMFFYNAAGSDAPQMTFKYRAFKLYTDTEYNDILTAMPSTASSSNKLLVTSDVTDAVTDGDTSPVTSNAVYDALSNVVVTPVDAVEDGNMNPVTSNAVYDALGNAIVTPVDAVTNGNMNPVTSNAVYDALHPTNPYSDWTFLWTSSGYMDYDDADGNEQAYIIGKIVNNIAYLIVYDDTSPRILNGILPTAFRCTSGPLSLNPFLRVRVEGWVDQANPTARAELVIQAKDGNVSIYNANAAYDNAYISYPIN